MNPTAIYSKSGKGVQEASGKTSLLKRPDRAVLAAIDGRAMLKEVAEKVGRPYDAAFQVLIQQLDKDGFIREVTAGAPSAPPSRPMSPPSRPAAPPKPAAKPAAMDAASDLDFSSLGATKIGGVAPARPAAPPSRPAAPPPSPQQVQQAKAQQSALDKAREEAEAKAAAERERVRKEAEDKARAELEVKMRAEAERKMKEEAEARAAAEAKAKAEAEARAKVEAERKAREEMERRLEAERKAREEAERKAKEEAERVRREAEEKARREAEELRLRLEAERKAREEAERKAREEAERLRKAAEEHARKVREEAERKAREEAERVRRELEAERQRLEEERRRQEEERQQQDAAAQVIAAAAQEAAKPEAPRAAPSGASFADSLMSDLESFTNKDEEEHKARAEAEQHARAEAGRRLAAEQAEARRREEEEARRREEEKRRAREEEERIAREEERRKREAEEIQRKAEAATAAAMAKQAAAAEEDIPISDDDLDLDEVQTERKALGIDEKKERQKEKEAEREARKRKRAEEKRRREAEKAAAKAAKAKAKVVAPSGRPRRSSSWGRPVAMFLAVVLIVAVGAAHVVPLDVAPYEQAATEALGQPVRIGSARLWLFTGVQMRLENVRVGDARIGRVAVHPALTSLILGGEKQQLSLVEIEKMSLPQAAFGEALFSRLKTGRTTVERVKVRELTLPGSLALPKPLEAEAMLDARGVLRSATLRGPDSLYVQITPKGDVLQLEATAGGLPLPIAPDVTLSQFAMKGTATRHGMDIAEWGGAIYNGAISGTAKMRWGSNWEVDGVLTVRGINAAVFAPALLSEGKAEGTGRFSMSGSDPAKLLAASHVEGRFTIGHGTLGSFDLSRAIQTRGKTVTGTTQFAELNGQVTYDRGAVALRNVTIGAGALNAGASADITKTGALSGRIIADVRTAAQTLSATLLLGGTVKEPQVRD
jgi:hypothetical protein